MSRHEVPVKNGIDATSAWIGWDRPMQTFYAQVLSEPATADQDDEILLWVGTDIGEISRPIDAIRAIEPYCDVPAELAATLEIERMKTLAAVDGPNQQEAKEFLRRLEQRQNRS